MKIVFKFLKRMALVSGLYSVVGFVAFMGLFGYLATSKSRSKLEAEILSTTAFIQSTYAQGDLVTLRTHLSSLSISRAWGSAYFANIDGERIWDNLSRAKSESTKKSLAYWGAWLIFKLLSPEDFEEFPYVIKSVEVRSWSEQPVGIFKVHFDITDDLLDYVNWITATAFLFTAYWVVYLGLAYRTARSSFEPVNALSALMAARAAEVGLEFSDMGTDNLDELHRFYNHFDVLANRWKDATRRMIEAERLKTQVDITRQVAHDIRSPLSALNMASSGLTDIPEDRRLIIRMATQRINDIANNLLKQSREKAAVPDADITRSAASPKTEPTMIAFIVDTIVSENRMNIRLMPRISIEARLEEGYGLFAQIKPSELARVLSNLLTNSIEAVSEAGKITVCIRGDEETVNISIHDNGRGMSEELLKRIGERGLSYGKEGTTSGSGLGLYYAKSKVESSGGNLKIASRLGSGTMVTIALPRAKPPKWFQEDLRLSSNTVIVSVDDDLSIHHLWAKRFDEAQPVESRPALLSFTSTSELESWFSKSVDTKALFLIDYEFVGEPMNGLDLIAKLGIAHCSVLVSSRYDDRKVLERARAMNVKVIPKGLAPHVPIFWL